MNVMFIKLIVDTALTPSMVLMLACWVGGDHHIALKDEDNFAERVKMEREKGKKKRNIFALRRRGKGKKKKRKQILCRSPIFVKNLCTGMFNEYWRVNNCPEPKIMTKKAKDKCNDKFGSGCGRSGRDGRRW